MRAADATRGTLLRRGALVALWLGFAGCALASSAHPVTPRDLAGDWRGRLALPLANAAATMTISDDGSYHGALHLDGGEDRPFNGAITLVRAGRLRYQSSYGNGSVMTRAHAGEITLRFVPDGGGGGGTFTRAR